MADRGNGIRMFNSREGFEQILAEFEPESDSENEEQEVGTNSSKVLTSQLRHFVVQV
jgi:tubulin---tyrosine ligase